MLPLERLSLLFILHILMIITHDTHLGAWTSHPQFEGTVPERRMGFISVAFLNRENTKKLEFHEIFKLRISRILIDSTEKSFYGAIP